MHVLGRPLKIKICIQDQVIMMSNIIINMYIGLILHVNNFVHIYLPQLVGGFGFDTVGHGGHDWVVEDISKLVYWLHGF